jgi:hypothetical protein
MKTSFRFGKLLFAATFLLSSTVATIGQVPQLLNYQGRIAVNGTNFTGSGLFKFALVDGGTNLTRAATGIATNVSGFLVGVNITDGGAGYTTPPTVSVIGGGGSGASFTAQISGGVVTNVIVNSAGSGYSGSPGIAFSPPASNVVAQTFWSNDGTSSSGAQPAASVPLPVARGLYSVLLGDTTLASMTTLPAGIFSNPDVRLRVWFNDGITGFQQLTPDQRLAAVGYAIMAGTVPDGSITAGKIAPGAVGSSQLSSNLTILGTMSVGNLLVNGSPLSGSASYQVPAGTNIQTQAGGSYFITNTSGNFILPPSPNVGDVIRLIFANVNGDSVYNVMQNPGQQCVKWNNFSPGGIPLVAGADGSRLVVGGNGYGFFLSTNSAVNWIGEPPLEPWIAPNYFDAIQMSGDGSHIFTSASFNNFYGLIISGDYGETWLLETNLPSDWSYITAIASSTNGVKVVAVGPAGVITSTDAGLNWTLRTSAPTNAYWRSVASSADGTKLVAIASTYGNNPGIYTSGNSGQTWTLQISAPTNASWTSVASSADGIKLVAAAYGDGLTGGIYTSVNSGQTWTLQNNAPTNASWVSVASSADGTKLVACAPWNGQASGIYTSVNSGSVWVRQTNGLFNGGQYVYAVTSSADGSKLAAFVGENNKIYRSVDSGNSWSPCSTIPSSYSVLAAVTTRGASGGARIDPGNNHTELTLVYLGNGMFAGTIIGNLIGY